MVVEFDVDSAHKPLVCLPADALSKREQAQCAVLAMPDSNTGLMGDSVFTFRMRRDRLPLFATSLAAHEHLFGTSFFRQVHDPSKPRSFSQRAVVAISRRPYPGLCAQIVRVSGPPFLAAAASGGPDAFAASCAVLESAWMESCQWPRPVPGVSYDHPMLGRLLHFRCPFTATTHGSAPGAADARVLAARSRRQMRSAGAIAIAATGSAAPLGFSSRVSSDGSFARHSRAESDALSSVDLGRGRDHSSGGAGGLGLILAPAQPASASADSAQSPGSDGGAPLSLLGAVDVAAAPQQRGSGAAVDGLADVADGGGGRPAHGRSPVLGLDGGVSEHDDDDDGDDDDDDDDAGIGPDGAAGAGRVTLGEAFAGRWQELPGIFQEVGLFSTFRAMAPCLWSLWEMALLGRPILVFGPSPKLCGDAVMGIVSLVAPLPFHGDFRPYFTLFDPDFANIQAAFETHRGPRHAGSHSALPPAVVPALAEAMEEERMTMAESPVLAAGRDPAGDEAADDAAPPASAADDPDSAAHGAGPDGRPSTPRAAVGSVGVPLRIVGRGHKHPFAAPPGPAASAPSPGPGPAPTRSPVPQLPASAWQTPLILGTTNPFFIQALGGFPVAVWIGSHPDALPSLPPPPEVVRTALRASSPPAEPAAAGAGAAAEPGPPGGAAAAATEAPVGTEKDASPAASDAASSSPPKRPGNRPPSPAGGMDSPLPEQLTVPQMMVRVGSDGARGDDATAPSQGDGAAPGPPGRAAASGLPAASVTAPAAHGKGVWKRATGGAAMTEERRVKLAARLASLRESRLRRLARHPRIDPTVVAADTPLHTLLPRPGAAEESGPRIIIRAGASTGRPGVRSSADLPACGSLVPPDPSVLAQLLHIRAEDEMGGPQLRLQGAGTGSDGGAAIADAAHADGGQVPGVVINDALLRQHFRRLTHAFLKPFERFFRARSVGVDAAAPLAFRRVEAPLRTRLHEPAAVSRTLEVVAREIEARETEAASAATAPARRGAAAGAASPAASRQRPTFGPYDNLAAALLPAFDGPTFLRHVGEAPPAAIVRRIPGWKELYSRFLESPHFRPWFTARREEARAGVSGLARRLRLAVSPEQLCASFRRDGEALTADSSTAADAADVLRLYSNVLSCVQRERAALDRDLEQSRAVAAHTAAIEEVVERMGLWPSLGV